MSDPKKEARLENGTWVDGNGKPLTNAELQAIKQDETIPGGRYVNADGFLVNANGQFIDESGRVVDRPVKAPQAQPETIAPLNVRTVGDAPEVGPERVARRTSKTDR